MAAMRSAVRRCSSAWINARRSSGVMFLTLGPGDFPGVGGTRGGFKTTGTEAYRCGSREVGNALRHEGTRIVGVPGHTCGPKNGNDHGRRDHGRGQVNGHHDILYHGPDPCCSRCHSGRRWHRASSYCHPDPSCDLGH
jgi:hypothetical protein